MGGRYSVTSAVGILPLALQYGFEASGGWGCCAAMCFVLVAAEPLLDLAAGLCAAFWKAAPGSSGAARSLPPSCSDTARHFTFTPHPHPPPLPP